GNLRETRRNAKGNLCTGQDVFLEYRHHDAGTKNDPSGLRPDTLPTPHAARLKSASVRRS
ncbi:hypothetical protein I6K60_26745, partial (plasmid) [Klebsiella pneumoniae]|uniref:hypothetical protein n=1 Tax=Klebsiella pneumoniae TaxID=573 RepID=UPI0019599CBD